MSPPHVHDHERENKSNINASPPQLKISKDSHHPMKRSSSASSSVSSSSSSSSSFSSSSSTSASSPQSSICSSSASTIISSNRGGPPATKPPPPHQHQHQHQQQRHQPVIIYTHSPKVINTHPRDFMALVQKLTGLYRPAEEAPAGPTAPCRPKPEGRPDSDPEENKTNLMKLIEVGNNNFINDEIESSSAVTEENNCGKNITVDHHGQVINPNSHFIPPVNYEPPTPYMNNFPMFNPTSTDFLCTNQSNFYSPYGDRLLFPPKNDETQFHQLPLWR